MTDKNDGGSAFPNFIKYQGGAGRMLDGMSLRDWFAGKTLCGMLASWPENSGVPDKEGIARECYAFAEAMLKEREK